MPVIKLTFRGKATAEYTCEAPRSACVIDELVGLASTDGGGIRAHAAAIGICVPRLARQLNAGANTNPIRFGQAMYDALRREGIKRDELMEAGGEALRFVMSQVIRDQEVEDAVGFTEAPEDPAGS